MTEFKKADLLKAKTVRAFAELVFPEAGLEEDGYHYGDSPDPNQIVIQVDDIGMEITIEKVNHRPSKAEYAKKNLFHPGEVCKFIFQEGKHMLLVYKDDSEYAATKFFQTRVDWNGRGITTSFVKALNALEYGNAYAFEDLFDRKEVTAKFYDDYIVALGELEDGVRCEHEDDRGCISGVIAERLIFLHFIQARNLLNRQTSYLHDKVYVQKVGTYRRFQDFCAQAVNTPGVNKGEWGKVPYLNGGLFRPNEAEERNPGYDVTDDAFRKFLAFLGGYGNNKVWHWMMNESGTDDDEQNTLDPALLGHIFEKTVNQKDAGAYYTPRPIAKYMSEQGIFGYLSAKLPKTVWNDELPESPKNYIEALSALDSNQLVSHAQQWVTRTTILDNACGSGAFLLTGLDVLFDLWMFITEKIGSKRVEAIMARTWADGQTHKYNVVKWIIACNIYGVDYEPGGVEVARLRLWLRLMAESAHEPEKVEPLPNIDYNLRAGNSLLGYAKSPPTIVGEHRLEKGYKNLLHGIPEGTVEGDSSQWDKGQHLAKALQFRSKVVAAYRQSSDPSVATLLRAALQAFDADQKPSVDAAWDAEVAHKLSSGRDPAWPIFKELRDTFIRPFHWFFEFPELMEEGGVAVLLTNPPWEKPRAETREFHGKYDPDFLNRRKVATQNLDARVAKLHEERPDVKLAWEQTNKEYLLLQALFKHGRFFRHQGKGDLDLFKLFFERYMTVVQQGGWLVPIVSGAIYQGGGCDKLRKYYLSQTTWHEMLGLQNRQNIFQGVDSRDKFALCVIQVEGSTDGVECFFVQNRPDAPWSVPRIRVTVKDMIDINGPGLKFPEVGSETELKLLKRIKDYGYLVRDNGWDVDWRRESDTSIDRNLFTDVETGVPLMEIRCFHQFDPYYHEPLRFVHADAWKKHIQSKTSEKQDQTLRLCYRKIARSDDARTVIAAFVPPGWASTDSLWTELVQRLSDYDRRVILAVMNSLVFDYLARRLVYKNVTKEIIQAIRVPHRQVFAPIEAELVALVNRLVDAKGPYNNDRARLDALVARAYGVSREELSGLWDDFRVLRDSHGGYMDKVLSAFDVIDFEPEAILSSSQTRLMAE